MRISLLFILFWATLSPRRADAQLLSPAEQQGFEKREDSLKKYSFDIVNAEQATDRFRADSQFVRSLVRTLKLPNSFYFPFDSLELDSIRTRRNWIGAIYYRIIEKSWQGRNYYTLLGFDDYSESSNKKWMEVLTFGADGEPRFGGPYFSFMEDSIRRPAQYRFNIEYKKEAGTRFNYDPEMGMIVYDHLVPEGDQAQKKETYVPDGDFEAFEWKNGKWVHVQKQLFNFKLKDGQFPMEAKMLDDQGKANELQLQQQSEKNVQKKKNEKPDPTKKPGS